MSSRLGLGIELNNNNSNSNNNSNNSNSNSNSNNNSLFSRNSNNSSNNSSSNENEWEEEVKNNTNSPKPHSRLRFKKTLKVKRINESGKSKKVPAGHRTKTRRHFGPNVIINQSVTRNRYSVARLIAAAHEKSHTYDEMKEFIERARAPKNMKNLALRKIQMKYPDFGK